VPGAHGVRRGAYLGHQNHVPDHAGARLPGLTAVLPASRYSGSMNGPARRTVPAAHGRRHGRWLVPVPALAPIAWDQGPGKRPRNVTAEGAPTSPDQPLCMATGAGESHLWSAQSWTIWAPEVAGAFRCRRGFASGVVVHSLGCTGMSSHRAKQLSSSSLVYQRTLSLPRSAELRSEGPGPLRGRAARERAALVRAEH